MLFIHSILSDTDNADFTDEFGLNKIIDDGNVVEAGVPMDKVIILIAVIGVLVLILIGVIVAFYCVRSR